VGEKRPTGGKTCSPGVFQATISSEAFYSAPRAESRKRTEQGPFGSKKAKEEKINYLVTTWAIKGEGGRKDRRWPPVDIKKKNLRESLWKQAVGGGGGIAKI